VLRWAKQQQMNIDREKRDKACEVIASMEDTIGLAITVQISTIFNVEQEDAFDLVQTGIPHCNLPQNQNVLKCLKLNSTPCVRSFRKSECFT
jgi:hypothetical protein